MKKKEKRIGKYIVLFLELGGFDTTDYEVSVHLNKPKGLILRKSYDSKDKAFNAYKKLNSVKAIKRWVGKRFNHLEKIAKGNR